MGPLVCELWHSFCCWTVWARWLSLNDPTPSWDVLAGHRVSLLQGPNTQLDRCWQATPVPRSCDLITRLWMHGFHHIRFMRDSVDTNFFSPFKPPFYLLHDLIPPPQIKWWISVNQTALDPLAWCSKLLFTRASRLKTAPQPPSRTHFQEPVHKHVIYKVGNQGT